MTLIERRFRERIVLVGVVFPWTSAETVEADLDELALLVDTAGADVAARVVQRRDQPDPATFVGKGKAAELHELSESVDADTVVFDDELSPAQQRNLEKILGRTAIDRTAVILDIFAQNARSQEGKTQVELALLRYRLPRLRGRGRAFSQQAGGIGTRGPGETQLEVDRRRVRERIAVLRQRLREVERTRRLHRTERASVPFPTVVLVGYTNAGKSTLMNALTRAGVLVEDRLFATLDPTVRRLRLPEGQTVLLSDTVGFIHKLPHQLVEAFKSTLEEVRTADLLVHVIDVAAPSWPEQARVVEDVLEEIGAGDRPCIRALNKVDLAPVAAPGAVGVRISARTGSGLAELLRAIEARLSVGLERVRCDLPPARGDLLAWLRRSGRIVEEYYRDGRVTVTALVPPKVAGQLRKRLPEAGAC